MDIPGGDKGYSLGHNPERPAEGEPIPLVTRYKPHDVVAYVCPKCKTVVAGVGKGVGLFSDDQAQEMARKHCGPWTCEDCGAEHERHYQPVCNACYSKRRAKHDQERDAAALAKAVKVHEWDGPVFWEGGPGDGFFQDVEDVIDSAVCDDRQPPEYVWACTVIHPQIDAGSIIESCLEDLHEDAYVDDEPELRGFLDQWNKAQTSECWEPNYKVAVLIEYQCDVDDGWPVVRTDNWCGKRRDHEPGEEG